MSDLKKKCTSLYFSYKFYCKVVRETMLHMYNIDESNKDAKILWKYFHELKVIWAKANTCALQRKQYMDICVPEKKRDVNHLREIELAQEFASKVDGILSKIITHINVVEKDLQSPKNVVMPTNIFNAISKDLTESNEPNTSGPSTSGSISLPNIKNLSLQPKKEAQDDEAILIQHIQHSKKMYMEIGMHIQNKMRSLLQDPSYADKIDPADVADLFIDMFFLDPENSEARDLDHLHSKITHSSYEKTIELFCIRCIDCVLLYENLSTLHAFITKICIKYTAGANRIDYIMNLLMFYLFVLEGEDDKAALIVRLNSCNSNGVNMEVLTKMYDKIKGTVKLKTKYLVLSLFTHTLPSVFEHALSDTEMYYMSLLVYQKELLKPKCHPTLPQKVDIFSKIHTNFFKGFYNPENTLKTYEKTSLAKICRNTSFRPDFFIHAKLFVNTTLSFIQKKNIKLDS